MGSLTPFPDHVGPSRERRKLARFLREIADGIEADALEVEPHALLMVLTGRDSHEVVACGYAKDAGGIRGAAQAAVNILTFGYLRRDGNIAKRQGHHAYGEPYAPQNVVLFARPAKKPAAQPARGEGPENG